MEIFIIILGLLALYIVIQVAIDRSINTALLKENNKLLREIRDLLKDINNKI
ncbi:hypothetical protein [Clostridium taeniosporum]|uniref:hypothetical protein n=1 Tax=Clostridium taeniosporum TaxID=394958 RepID=UPI001864D823|nr:hypothetical protein [Clostridium taeniosporum]